MISLFQSSAVEESVVRPLAVLGDLLQSPGRLCGKRNDKLMDFTAAVSKLRQNRDSNKKSQYEEELSLAKTTYEALNSQLVDELPALIDLGTRQGSMSVIIQAGCPRKLQGVPEKGRLAK